MEPLMRLIGSGARGGGAGGRNGFDGWLTLEKVEFSAP